MILMNQQNNNIYNIKMVLFIQICTKIFLRNEKKNKKVNKIFLSKKKKNIKVVMREKKWIRVVNILLLNNKIKSKKELSEDQDIF